MLAQLIIRLFSIVFNCYYSNTYYYLITAFDNPRTDDVYGSIVGSSNISYAGEEGIDLYYLKHQKRWKEVAEDLGCAYIPSGMSFVLF